MDAAGEVLPEQQADARALARISNWKFLQERGTLPQCSWLEVCPQARSIPLLSFLACPFL
jgi:hypothetical protein